MAKACPICAYLEREVLFLRELSSKLLDQNAQLRGLFPVPDSQMSQPEDDKYAKSLNKYMDDVINGGSEENTDDEQIVGLQQS